MTFGEVVAAWRNRPLAASPYTFAWIDALPEDAGVRADVQHRYLGGQRRHADRHREILGIDTGSAENGASWTAFLRGLRARGLQGSSVALMPTPTPASRRHRRAGR